jgi:hypothetical protein
VRLHRAKTGPDSSPEFTQTWVESGEEWRPGKAWRSCRQT